jgi:hypothetical protein
MAANLQKLFLAGGIPLLYWDQFSTELASALVDQFRSPMLTAVNIWHCNRLPLSVITNFIHVKRLSFVLTRFHDDSDGGRSLPVSTLRLPQLHALEIQRSIVGRNDQLVKLFPQMDNLQLLCIRACDPYTLSVAQEVIRSCASSLRSVIWCYGWMKEEGTSINSLVIMNSNL